MELEAIHQALLRLLDAPADPAGAPLAWAKAAAKYSIHTLIAALGLNWLFGGDRDRRSLVLVVLAVPLSLILNHAIAQAFPYPHPLMTGVGRTVMSGRSESGLPSDQASPMWTIAFGVLLWSSRKWLGWAAVALAAATSWARVLLGVHLPFDILGSIAVGIAAVAALVPFRPMIERRVARPFVTWFARFVRALGLHEREQNVLAFGVEPSTCRYRLRAARYLGIAAFIRSERCRREREQSSTALRVLDVGCGDGNLALYLRLADVELTAFDVSAANLERARQRGYDKVCQGDVRAGLSFPDQSFDIVVCSHVLEHLLEPRRLVKDIQRVLRPGGLLVAGVPMHTWWLRLLRVYVAPVFMPRKRRSRLIVAFGHVQFFTLPSLLGLLQDFCVEDVRGYRLFSAGRWLPLEDWYWYYRINLWWGKRFPNLTGEVNVVARNKFNLQGAADRILTDGHLAQAEAQPAGDRCRTNGSAFTLP